ncbi:MAG: B12-binding domain-containing radical SAM protein [Nanoarchaeota archaeon]|nr:B12-binding domain-containing radical SAM protein [Nanoarchaeota archaeon]MBU1028276.1 B12-binding domain-containing radical SAM protein [Nanoarchaeota archaeon]
MKILLIEPNFEGYVLMPTMSLAVLKSYINNKTKHQAKIVDLIFNKKKWKEYLSKKIKEFNPDLIGLSILSFNYIQAIEISKFIKNHFKNKKIIFGGVHAILSPEETINNSSVDMICIGEGEETLKELLDKELQPKNVKGLWYKKNNKIIKNENRVLIEDLNSLPYPNWEDFDLKKYFLINNNHLPIMGSRGCPYQCTYCSNHALKKKLKGKYVRFRSVENILEEIGLRISQFHGKGMKYLFFYDDTFIISRNFVLEFCKKFIEKGFHKKLKWNVNVRANLVTKEIIRAMKKAGCYEVRMGVEAGNDYIRNKIYKRNMSKKQIFNAVKIIKKQGLQLRLQFILGAPYETKEMMQESFEMAKKLKADYVLFPILMPIPETEIKKMCEKEGLIEKEKFENFHDNSIYIQPVMKTKYVSKNQIKKFVKKIRNYQIKKYLYEGFKFGKIQFILDSLVFLLYYKRKYDLELDHAFRFTVNKYNLQKIK